MSILDSLLGTSKLPSHLAELNKATSEYNQNQMKANEQLWADSASSVNQGPNTDMSYATAMGGYLNQNPYINTIANNTASSIVNSYNNSTVPDLLSSYAASGRYGSGSMTDAMVNTQSQMYGDIGTAVNDLYYKNYAQERGYMEDAQNRLGEQYDSLSRYATYGDILNAGQYSTLDEEDSRSGILDIVAPIGAGIKAFS